jgi:branched-chain amino acid transport system substrate-binding protein
MPRLLSLLAIGMAFALCCAAGAAWAQAPAAGNPVRIGFGGALNGNLASYGRSNLFGIEYALKQVNSKGGILGRQVEIVQADDLCTSERAPEAAAKLKSEGLTLILGHTCSGATRNALNVYANTALVISASSTENSLTFDGQNPYFFRTTPYDSAQSKLQVDLIQHLGLKKVAILYHKSNYGEALAKFTAAYIRELPGRPVDIVLEEGVDGGKPNYDDAVASVVNSGADSLVWAGYYPDGSKIAAGLRNAQSGAVIIGPDGLYDQQYIALAGPAAEGTFATAQTDFSESEEAKAAIADHRSRHKDETGAYFFYSIAAAQAMFKAIEAAGSTTDLNAIKKHLTEDTVDTIIGPVRFDARGDVIGALFKVYQVQNGAYQEYQMGGPAAAAASAPAPEAAAPGAQ